jgi:hypothetical protein
MNLINPETIPEFQGVSHFADWYLENKMPLLFSFPQEIFITDDATAVSLFRHGRYQVEMYLIHPQPVIPKHEHPGVENIEITIEALSKQDYKLLLNPQQEGVPHGPGIKAKAEHNGFMLFSAQKWNEGLEISTIGSRWKGHTAGPKHEALIKRFNPDCFMYPGYADVTRKNAVAPIL